MDPAQPRIGVVTICWNDLAGLQATLASAAGQTRAPHHQVVVDGGSTDGTSEWLAAARLAPFVTWSSEKDHGIYDAMNKGIAAVGDSDIVVFMNAGDRFADADTLEVVAADQRERGWQWAYGDAAIVDGQDRVMWMHHHRHLRRARFVLGLGSVPHQAVYFTTPLLRRIGGFRTDLPVVADQEHIYRAWTASPPAYLAHTLARCDGGGVSTALVPGTFALQMAEIRRASGQPIAKSLRLDEGVTSAGRRYLAWRARARARKQARAGLSDG